MGSPSGVVDENAATSDYTKVFVTRQAVGHHGIDRIVQTELGLDQVLAGLHGDATRSRDALLTVLRAS